MSDHHHHHHDHSGPIAIGETAARVVVGLLAVIGVAVVAGLIWLWPSAQHIDIPLPMQNGSGGAVQTEAGTVVKQDLGQCGDINNGKVFAVEPDLLPQAQQQCPRSVVSIESGVEKGNWTLFVNSPTPDQPNLHVGDKLRIVRQENTDPVSHQKVVIYSFDDYARGLPLILIGVAFAVVVIAVARWRGLRALIGLVVAFGVLVGFMLPALLDGKPAIPVALVAGAMILYSVLYLAHGVNLRTSSALLGTLTSMVLAAVLSWVALKITHLTGLSEEQNTNVAAYIQHVSITGLLLAGFIIGSLGVLNDVTITQASAAFELAALDEKATRRGIFAAAMRVGRDHIASTVYTLVLAYAGGALPLLMLFSVAGRSIHDVLTGDAVGIEIARSAVGGIALALSVPLTTAIAVVLARPFGAKPATPPATGRRARGEGAQSNRSRRPGEKATARAGARSGGPRTGAQAAVPRAGAQPGGPRTGAQPAARRSGPTAGPGTGGQPAVPRPARPGPPTDSSTVPRTGVVQPNSPRQDSGRVPRPRPDIAHPNQGYPEPGSGDQGWSGNARTPDSGPNTSSWFNPGEEWSNSAPEPRDQGWAPDPRDDDEGWPPEAPGSGRHSRY